MNRSNLQSIEMLKNEMWNVCDFQKHLLFAHRSKHRYNGGTQISGGTRWTAHKHVVSDAIHSKKGSSALYSV